MKKSQSPLFLTPSRRHTSFLGGVFLGLASFSTPCYAGFYLGALGASVQKKTNPVFPLQDNPDASVTSSYGDTSTGYGLSLGYRMSSSNWAIESSALLVASPLSVRVEDGPVSAEGEAVVDSLQIPILLRWVRFSYLSLSAGAYVEVPYTIESTGDIEGLSLEYDWGVSGGLRFQAPLFNKSVTLSSELRVNQGIKNFSGSRNRDHLLLLGITFGGQP